MAGISRQNKIKSRREIIFCTIENQFINNFWFYYAAHRNNINVVMAFVISCVSISYIVCLTFLPTLHLYTTPGNK